MKQCLSAVRCPVCKKHVFMRGNSLICKKGHCFDLSKTGYVNFCAARDDNTLAEGVCVYNTVHFGSEIVFGGLVSGQTAASAGEIALFCVQLSSSRFLGELYP